MSNTFMSMSGNKKRDHTYKKKVEEKTEDFILIPHVKILKGKIVAVKGGAYVSIESGKNLTILDNFFKNLSEKFSIVFISDLDGIGRNRPQLDTLQNIERESDFNEIWVDGGVRIAENVIDLLVAGASKVVLSTRTIYSLEEIKEACALSQNLVLYIAFREGVISSTPEIRNLSAFQLVDKVKGYGINSFVLEGVALMEDMRKVIEGGYYLVALENEEYNNWKHVMEVGAKAAIIDVEKLINKNEVLI